jgi:hypothetical protein
MVGAGNSQAKQNFNITNTRFMLFNLAVILCRFNANRQLGYFVSIFSKASAHLVVQGKPQRAVGHPAATMGIDLSVWVGRALISYSNQALRTWHW